MADRRAEDGREDQSVGRTEFVTFRTEIRQELREIRDSLRRLSVDRHVDEEQRQRGNGNYRQPTPVDESSGDDDDEYIRNVFQSQGSEGRDRAVGRNRYQRFDGYDGRYGRVPEHEQRRQYGGYEGDRNRGGFRMKVELPKFNGHLHIEDFLDWLAEVERFFEYMEIPEDKRVQLVAYRLKGGASAWWEQLQLSRTRAGKSPVRTWPKMKRLLKVRFLPSDYEQVLFQQLQNCKQGNRSIALYTEEYYRLSSRNDLIESENQKVARYIGGLRLDIQDKVVYQSIHSVDQAVSFAGKAESQLERSSSYYDGSHTIDRRAKSSLQIPLIPQESDTASSSNKPAARQVPEKSTREAPKNPYVKPVGDKCYRCGEPGHRSNACTKRAATHLVKAGGEPKADGKPNDENCHDGETCDDESEEELTYGDQGVALVIRRLMCDQQNEEPSQRHKIFQTKCTVKERICNVIIDGGSSENLVSKLMVSKLNLPTYNHPAPYSISWLEESSEEVKVTEQCRVSFSIGKYQDEVICDIIDMNVCHVLLGRPWIFDLNVVHKGRENSYTFYKGGRKFTLVPTDYGESSVLLPTSSSLLVVPLAKERVERTWEATDTVKRTAPGAELEENVYSVMDGVPQVLGGIKRSTIWQEINPNHMDEECEFLVIESNLKGPSEIDTIVGKEKRISEVIGSHYTDPGYVSQELVDVDTSHSSSGFMQMVNQVCAPSNGNLDFTSIDNSLLYNYKKDAGLFKWPAIFEVLQKSCAFSILGMLQSVFRVLPCHFVCFPKLLEIPGISVVADHTVDTFWLSRDEKNQELNTPTKYRRLKTFAVSKMVAVQCGNYKFIADSCSRYYPKEIDQSQGREFNVVNMCFMSPSWKLNSRSSSFQEGKTDVGRIADEFMVKFDQSRKWKNKEKLAYGGI